MPSPSNLLEWHYVLEGDKDSEYGGGYYHGKIIFPPGYPFKPPSILMLTPSGRFEPGAKICLSMSDFHPESWNPLWGVSMILLGLQSFFYEGTSTTGALHGVSADEKRRLAARSLEHNARNPVYRKLFPDLIELAVERSKEAQREAVALKEKEAAMSPEERKLAEVAAAAAAPRHQDYGGLRELFLGAAVLMVAMGMALVALNQS